ncbi:aminoglycoside phosphotransferase family protein [Acinetobacter sp. NIPH 1852]|uniref:phosphotransferase n=1 Tax=Acinetobacter sp. NIPH 1852 TaxID=2923428 RepID=UPI001F4B058B|nr:phosphotransferase [Acinetobacter sp. NIPH 1852]MCH7309442.1 aminoglycoside phosphotransferase family protein [Acinetobacter sp. NIPH 1852]
MILIASGAYVTSDFQVELGKIPPCLLPVGNKKLIELQVATLKNTFKDEEIFLTLPESYHLSSAEVRILSSLHVNLVFIPDDFKLTESILYVLNTNEYLHREEALYLLHGDTYFSDFNGFEKVDILAVAKSFSSYNWEVVRSTNQHALVWCGFFSFSSISYLLKALTIKKNSFVDAIKFYSDHYHLDEFEVKNWFDFGHANTYFFSRANITTERAFNNLNISNGVVKKQGKPNVKIDAEALWYINVPTRLKKYIPVLLDYQKDKTNSYYCLEYLPYIPLNELFVHGKNETLQWNKILDKIFSYMSTSMLSKEDVIDIEFTSQNIRNLYMDKSRSRFKQYLDDQGILEDKVVVYKDKKLPKLSQLLEDCIEKVEKVKVIYGVMHGDLCFSNILFDSRGDRIKVIDPRGLNFKNEFSLFGDIKYDLAKVTHSIVGMYDFIISGYYKLEETANGSIQIVFDIDERTKKISHQFIEDFEVDGVNVKEIIPLVILLFLSMLPLHSDRPDRQKAMFYNALRLYYEYIV